MQLFEMPMMMTVRADIQPRNLVTALNDGGGEKVFERGDEVLVYGRIGEWLYFVFGDYVGIAHKDWLVTPKYEVSITEIETAEWYQASFRVTVVNYHDDTEEPAEFEMGTSLEREGYSGREAFHDSAMEDAGLIRLHEWTWLDDGNTCKALFAVDIMAFPAPAADR